MSPPGRDVSLSVVHDTIRVGFEQLDRRLGRLELDTNLIRESYQTVSTKVALIEQECHARGKRISELVKRVGGVENTGIIYTTKAFVTWRTIAIIFTTIAAIAGLGVGFAKLIY